MIKLILILPAIFLGATWYNSRRCPKGGLHTWDKRKKGNRGQDKYACVKCGKWILTPKGNG